jgi:hypothetical protein
MSELQANIFPILNLNELSSAYRLHPIRGMRPGQPEYYQNKQNLIRILSYRLRSPVTVIERNGQPHLVLRTDAEDPPSPFPLVRTQVVFDAPSEEFELDYSTQSPETDEIRLRFLNFMLQHPLSRSPALWQPGAGKAFFRKEPEEQQRGVDRYLGFSVRAVLTADGGMGLCVDSQTKFVSTAPLSQTMTREGFRRFKRKHCIYHFGHQWFDIQISELSDLNASETIIPTRAGTQVPLIDYIASMTQKPLPKELVDLSDTGSVLLYSNNQRESRAAPTGLCHLVFDTQSREVQRNHRKTVPPPHVRYKQISQFVKSHLRELKFGRTLVRVATRGTSLPQKMFVVPDLEFGNGKVLSVRGTAGAIHTSLDKLGRDRSAMLSDRSAGCFLTDPLRQQYLVLPKSIADSVGERFRHDLAEAVDALFSQEHGYDPMVVTYNDRGPKTFLEQGRAILEATREQCRKPGYALVMIHETQDRRIREHDQLAAMVIRELRSLGIIAAVNHSEMARNGYTLLRRDNGLPRYVPDKRHKGKLRGYLRNVALSKVLLTNERWPFVLATPLHADITVGIDVKSNTAGFTLVAQHGRVIRTQCFESSQREKLHAKQVRKYLVELISEESPSLSGPVRRIVIHRDGRTYDSEVEGIERAVVELRDKGIVGPDGDVTILEIAKSSLVPIRLFDVANGANGQSWIENPQVGAYHIGTSGDAYLCATGRAFPRDGTVQPLHVHSVVEGLPFEQALEDVYALTTLAWSRPEDCTRYPITIKLTDRRLGEDAGEYDADALEYDEKAVTMEETQS